MAEPTVSTGAGASAGVGARTLVLMRHAAAGSAVRDHDRPLTPDGVRAATEAGRWLRANLPAVNLAICSTAARARQTLAAAGVSGQVRYADELYGGGVDEILQQVATAPANAATLLVVGHAPTIPSTAWELVSQARLTGGPDASSSTDEKELRRFAAGTFAVLTTAAEWADLAEAGADLQAVRHPVH
ncbi:MAG TPA: histidine phosphatase family protein [Nakamurella sp.]